MQETPRTSPNPRSHMVAPQSHILFDGLIAEKRGQILQPFPMVTKRGTTMDAVLVGEDVSQHFLGVN
jgi:hypothetical protein